MRHEIISLKDLKGLYLLRRRFKKWRQNEWKNHVVYVYRVWAEKAPLIFSWIKEYILIYLQTDCEMHWILRIFYRIFWISIFNTCSYGELFTGVSSDTFYFQTSKIFNKNFHNGVRVISLWPWLTAELTGKTKKWGAFTHLPPPPHGAATGWPLSLTITIEIRKRGAL